MKHYGRKIMFAVALGSTLAVGLGWASNDWETRWVGGLFAIGLIVGIGIYIWQLEKEKQKRKDDIERRKLR